MATKKNPYIGEDLEWLKEQAVQMKTFVNNNPVHKLKDREVKGKIVQTIEGIHKNIRETLKDHAQLLEAISRLEQLADTTKRLTARGDAELGPIEQEDE